MMYYGTKTTYKDGFDIKKEMLGHVEELKENLPVFLQKTVKDQLQQRWYCNRCFRWGGFSTYCYACS